MHSQGAQSPLRLLLNQSDSAALTRNLTYHRYLLEAQQAQVAHYVQAIKQHQQLEDELTATIAKLQQLQLEADREQQTLAAKREQRQALLNKTSKDLDDKEGDLKRQQQDRKALQTLIARIEKQRQLDLAREAERKRLAEAKRLAEVKRQAEANARAEAARLEAERLAAEQAAQAAPPEVGGHIEPAGPIVAGNPPSQPPAVAATPASTAPVAPPEITTADEPEPPAKREQAPAYSSRDLAKLKGMSFAASRGQLARPAQGAVISRYGQPRQGEIKWEGIRIAAAAGSPVRAAQAGRVMYADWLRGQGMLMVIDHGQGYMTLYAHNDSLLKQPGDFVEIGETIARVGNSGGEQEPALYFEIRHNGATINPEPWLGR